ncbi:uncharacterized protein LOC114277720 [Camellia sinensis]|uniref:uncharacterized protein LOC114277720 n=1 Tax=Camellia sinensis TaxID=4442 RepID=UPI001036AEE5|nr:uncharacterized protein LOC114277720 [Camellia sinensis]
MPTYAEVLDKAIQAEANLNRYQSSGENQRKRQNYDNRRGQRGTKKKPNVGSAGNLRQEGSAKPTCSDCGKQHFGVCRRKSGACYECGEVGHYVKDCPKTKTDNNKKGESTLGSAQKDAYVLIDSGSTHLFVSAKFAEKIDRELEPLDYVLSLSTPFGRSMIVAAIYRACVVVIENVELLVDLMPLDVAHFDVILGMDCIIFKEASKS